MKKITHDIIKELATQKEGPKLTMYMPMHASLTPPNLQENKTRYKSMIRHGFESLKEHYGDTTLEYHRKHLEDYLDDSAFWQSGAHSFGVFIDESEARLYHLPLEIAEQTYVGDTFDTVPLLQLNEMGRPYYLFTLAMHESKLYRGDLYGLEEIDIDFPKSVEAALNIDEMFINSNTIRQGSGSMKTNPHGQGDSQEAGKEERLMYFRILDHLIHKSDGFDSQIPFLIAATDSEAGDFRTVSKLPNILECHLAGNHTKDDLDELHQHASQMVNDELLDKEAKVILDQYERSVGSQKTAHDLNDIEEAAKEGRIDRLLLNILTKTKDTIGNRTDGVSLAEQIDDGVKQSVLAVIKDVLSSGGSVRFMTKQLMPAPVPVAAMYRY